MRIREATLEDAPHIARLHREVWIDEQTDAERIAAAFAVRENRAALAFMGESLAGYVDGFVTYSADGVKRWEVDLLAVHPDFRGHRLAPYLIAASLDDAESVSARVVRGLVQAENVPAEKSFARCGFVADEHISGLYVATPDGRDTPATGAFVIPVQTFTYTGVWVEGVFAPDAGLSAQGEVAGMVIPLSDTDAIQAAESAGYALVNHYRYWRLWL